MSKSDTIDGGWFIHLFFSFRGHPENNHVAARSGKWLEDFSSSYLIFFLVSLSVSAGISLLFSVFHWKIVRVHRDETFHHCHIHTARLGSRIYDDGRDVHQIFTLMIFHQGYSLFRYDFPPRWSPPRSGRRLGGLGRETKNFTTANRLDADKRWLTMGHSLWCVQIW